MSKVLGSQLENLVTQIEEARKGNSIAQKDVSEYFASGQIILRDTKMAAFWSKLSEESQYYRTTRHPIKTEFSRPFNFIAVESDYAREINITPLNVINEYADKAINLVDEHKKRTTYTYIVNIKKYDTSKEFLGLMGASVTFGWTASETRSIFASLPYKVASITSKEDAMAAIDELKKSGVTAEFQMINGLGEDVTNGTWVPAPALKQKSQSAPEKKVESEKISLDKTVQINWPKFCNQCGAKLTPGAKFCKECGNKIEVK